MELKNATVLVADDEEMLLDIFREWLQEEGCRVLTAENGAVALEILRREHADVIVSDVRMPLMDGIQLLKKLAEIQPGNHPPKMIFISGFHTLETREAYDLGAEGILLKPIKRDQFLAAVRRSLRSREEAWAGPPAVRGQQLSVTLPRVSAAIEEGQIAFGRGGFCVRHASPLREGPVKFALKFEDETIAGHGLVCWADPDESLIGVEICGLDAKCRARAVERIMANSGSSYIPGKPQSATRTFKMG